MHEIDFNNIFSLAPNIIILIKINNYFIFLAAPEAYESSWARDRIQTAAVTYATAAATAGSLIHCATAGTPYVNNYEWDIGVLFFSL